MSHIHVGPGGLPSRESPEAALDLLRTGGYGACEIDFGDGFWMDWEFARRLGELAEKAGVRLSLHAPLAAFLGHVDRGGRKHNMAVGMLDHSAGIAAACHAAPVVIHPGFLLGRAREPAIDEVVAQLAELRARLSAKGRAVPFGVEVMGRVNELGSLDDVLAICRRLEWVRPVLDFAHMHATSDGGFASTDAFAAALARADAALAPGTPFHIHFSDISFANRNEKSHVHYGQGTLRVEPLARALLRFSRPATIILESPDEDSNRAITAALRRGGEDPTIEASNGPRSPGQVASGAPGCGRPPARQSGRGGLHSNCRETPGRPEWLWPPSQGWGRRDPDCSPTLIHERAEA